jgi:membrane protein
MMLKHEAPRDAAAISYFSLIAMFPATLVMVAVVDAFWGWMNLHGTVIQLIVDFFPGPRQLLRSDLNELTSPSTPVVLSCTAVFIWSSSWIFSFLESAINRAWEVPHQRTFWESRLRSIAFMLLGGVSLLATAAITAVVGIARSRAAIFIPPTSRANALIGWFWYIFLLGTGLLIAILVFAFIFKWTPHRRVYWNDAFSGSLVFIIIWEISSIIFVKLMPYFNYQRVYGRTGAVIVLLVWVYTSILILLFGVNYSAQWHRIRQEQPIAKLGAPSKRKTAGLPLHR